MTKIEDYVESLVHLDHHALNEKSTLDTVIACISTPLSWINTLSTQDSLTLLHHKAWKKHVWHVYKELVPSWSFSLLTATNKQLIDDTLFCSSNATVMVTMATLSLPVLIECVCTQKEASLDTIDMYAHALKRLSLDHTLFRLYSTHIPTKDIPFFCSLLCSISGHLVNVYGLVTQRSEEWYSDRHFYASISRRLAECLNSRSISFVGELLGKMIRQGYEVDIAIQSIYPTAQYSPECWNQVFEMAERSYSSDTIYRSMLLYIRNTVLPHSTIQSTSKHLALILFGSSSVRIHQFLHYSLLRLSKMNSADLSMIRVAIATSVYAAGIEPGSDDQWKLSVSAHTLIMDTLKQVTQAWIDPVFIQHGSSKEHEYVTAALLCLIGYILDDKEVNDYMTECSIVPGITKYLESENKRLAELGMTVAEAISVRVDKDKPFHSGMLDKNQDLVNLKHLVFQHDALVSTDDRMEPPEPSYSSETEEEDELDPDALFQPIDSDQEGSEDELEPYAMEEESDDDDKHNKTKKPAFIADLIRYLKDKNDPIKLQMGLNYAEYLIRMKTGTGTELKETSVELARYLIDFPTDYDIKDCHELQQKALVALVVAVPKTVTSFIIDELYNRNSSVPQRELILGSILLAVRELAGWANQDESTDKKILESQPLGQSLFVSRRMEVEKKKKVRRNEFAELAGPVFFFPLLVGWWEGGQERIKFWLGNNKLMAERFVMTMNVILHSATNTPDKRQIVREYFEFAFSMRYSNNAIVRSLLLGIEIILNISYQHQEALLFNHHQKELSETRDWVESILENNTEHELQQLAMNIMIRLSQMATTMTQSY
ncbi:telomere length regulation protein-domain-containing protein [Pilobolus umbonatus]|nr:telomere length regulation protein-domain-containing protein [Pilobolus umbonatus]